MDNLQLLSRYESLAAITDQMLDAARAADWERLVALEARCASEVAYLKAQPALPLSGRLGEQKARILNRILADDREIRSLTQPWMSQLAARINSARAERRLNQAYGGQPPA